MFKSLLFLITCVVGLSFVTPQPHVYAEDTVKSLLKDLKGRSPTKQMNAAEKLSAMGPEAIEAKSTLLKKLAKAKKAEHAVAFLSAYLTIAGDDPKAFNLFKKTALKQRGKKYEKGQKTSKFFQELSTISIVTPGLIDFIDSIKNIKGQSSHPAKMIYSSLIKSHPPLFDLIVERLQSEPEDAIFILARQGESARKAIPDIKKVAEKSPQESLKLFRQLNLSSDVFVQEFALNFVSDAKNKPARSNRFHLSRDNDTAYDEAVKMLALTSPENEKAHEKLLELLASTKFDPKKSTSIFGITTDPSVKLAKNILKFGAKNISMIQTITDILVDRLPALSALSNEDNQAYSHLASDHCSIITDQPSLNTSQADKIINIIRSSTNVITQASCTLALGRAADMSANMQELLEVIMQTHKQSVFDDFQKLQTGQPHKKNTISSAQFFPSMAPNVAPLYAAAVISKFEPDNVAALLVFQQYVASGLPFFDEFTTGSTLNFPASKRDINGQLSYFVALTPRAAISFSLENDGDAWSQHVQNMLKDEDFSTNLSAARLIMQRAKPLTKSLQALLLQKLSMPEAKAGFPFVSKSDATFIEVLKFAKPNEELLVTLKKFQQDKNINTQKAASYVLQHLNTKSAASSN